MDTNTAMEWNGELDEFLLQEVMVCEPFEHKPFTRERGKVWEEISERLNTHPAFKNRLKQRSVRDRYTLLAKKYKKRMTEEERASGISPPELTPVEQLVSELIEKFKEGDQRGDKNKKEEQSKLKGEEMRRISMEKLGETSKRRRGSDEETTPKRTRASGRETLVYLREKGERELVMKKEEMEMQAKENIHREQLQEALLKQQQEAQQTFANMFLHMQQQQQQQQQQWQQQQQQQQQQLQLQQQQHALQSKLLMALIEKINKQ